MRCITLHKILEETGTTTTCLLKGSEKLLYWQIFKSINSLRFGLISFDQNKTSCFTVCPFASLNASFDLRLFRYKARQKIKIPFLKCSLAESFLLLASLTFILIFSRISMCLPREAELVKVVMSFHQTLVHFKMLLV